MSAQPEQDATPGIKAPLEGNLISDEEFFEKNATELSFCESETKEVAIPHGEGTSSSKYDLLSDEEFLEEVAITETDVLISDEEFFEKNAAELSFCESETKEVAIPHGEETSSSKYDLLSDEEFLEEVAITETDVDVGMAVTQSHESEKRNEGCYETCAEATLECTADLERLVGGPVVEKSADSPGSPTESTELCDSLFSKALNEYERAENQSET